MIWRTIYNAYCNNCRRNNRDLAVVSLVMVRLSMGFKVLMHEDTRKLRAMDASSCLVPRVTGDNIEEAEKLV